MQTARTPTTYLLSMSFYVLHFIGEQLSHTAPVTPVSSDTTPLENTERLEYLLEIRKDICPAQLFTLVAVGAQTFSIFKCF